MTGALVVFLGLAVLILFVLSRTAVVVPQQSAFVVERLGRYRATLDAGFHILLPFVDAIRYRHSLKENALDIPEQICITKDNVQVHVDGVLYLKVLNPERASYGVADYLFAITQLAQTALRSEIGKIELDRTFEERTHINLEVVNELDKATEPWGIKVLRYEIKNITPPADVLAAMEKQMRAEREKRAVILTSEGQRDAAINTAEGEKQQVIKASEAKRQQQINEAEGQGARPRPGWRAGAEALRRRPRHHAERRNGLGSAPGERAARPPVVGWVFGEGGERGKRLRVRRERKGAQVRGELGGGRGAREHDVDEGLGQHEGERELIDATAEPAGRLAERAQQARVLRAGVGRCEAPVGERLLHDDAEPGVVGGGEGSRERGLEAVEGRLHDVEDGLAVGAGRPRLLEGARRDGAGEREPDGAIGAGTAALHQGAQQ